MPFGGSLPHFPYVIFRQTIATCLQDKFSSNYMLMIILLFEVKGEKHMLLEGLVMQWQVCVCETMGHRVDLAINHSVAWRNEFCFRCLSENHLEILLFISG